MIEVQTKGNSIVCVLEGVLNAATALEIEPAQLHHKKVQLLGRNIESWNTDFVVTLFNALRFVPKENISYSQLPEGMEQLLRLAFQAPFTETQVSAAKLPFLERLGEAGIRFCRSVKRGCLFIHKCLLSWGRQLTGNAVYRSKDFWMILADCGPKSIFIVSLISFMVGLILAFVGAIQLKTFGAQIYVASLVTIGMTETASYTGCKGSSKLIPHIIFGILIIFQQIYYYISHLLL